MATKMTGKKPAENGATKPSLRDRIYTSFDQVTEAYNTVRDELIDLGLLWKDSKLDRVDCFYEPIAPVCALRGWMGYYDYSDKNIHFPSVYLPFGWLIGKGDENDSAPDVIRHEFGHALADRYPKALEKGGLFRKAFGGTYSNNPVEDADTENLEFEFVSKYASSATREDFAETFMFFLKYSGRIPACFTKKPAIARKWKAVAEIVQRVAAATR